MRVLLLNQFFWPDAAATSQLLTDVAQGMRSRGFEVHIISAENGYALEDSTPCPDVVIHRVKSVRFVRGPLGRIASYASFFLGCAWRGLRVPQPDIVVTLTTPPLLSLIGNLLKVARGSRHFVWEMDMYPDVAVDLNYIPADGVADRVIGSVAVSSRRYADGILALGECMRDRLVRRGVRPDKISVAQNWADSSIILPASFPTPDEPFTVLYSGNLGLAHDVFTISEVMEALRNNSNFQFVFAGSGARRANLESFCSERGLTNVSFRSYSAKASLGESLGGSHVGLITQQEACLGSVVPSKIYGLMAAGRPVLFIGPRESTVAKIIRLHRCGWQIDCGDVESLHSLLEYLEANRSQVMEAGERAREALLNHYDLPLGVARVCALISEPSQGDAPGSLLDLSSSRSLSRQRSG